MYSLEKRSQDQVIKDLLNVFGRGWNSVEGNEQEEGQGIEREIFLTVGSLS